MGRQCGGSAGFTTNAVLRARLADDLALLRELQGAPFVSQECPPDVSPSRLLFHVLEDCS
ncbi:hypothetical protein TRIUR3_01047 [Triticum urartu]|uniref:Uncharacterized protein n=1 Tax=Triticum urartu TaxID=4572 RepID=M7YG77_TRIUA|nr:hypothetical protein TRIUR3_01047 [Triticum urartu]